MLLAVSLMLPYLFGLGALLYLFCGSFGKNAGVSCDSASIQGLATCLIFGVLINHFLMLLLSDLNTSLLVGCALSVVALTLAAKKGTQLRMVVCPRWLVPVLVLYLACVFLATGEPVSGWDARSIWFFHGKMIFYNASVDAGGDWTLPYIGFSHTDYPLLIPILAAQIASVAGYWNEYLPKLSLVALLLPAILFLLSILDRKWWHVIFVVVPLFFLGPWLTNGYMDGYLALYAGFGCLYLGRWLDQGKRLDLVTGVLAMGIVLDLKNEGMLYALIVSALLCCFLLLKRVRLAALQGFRWWEYLTLFSVAVSGWGLWARKKHLFTLKNDLQLGPGSLETVHHRLSEGALTIILKYLYVTDNVNLSLGIFLLSLVYKFQKGERPGRGGLLCALAAFFYFFGIVTIYLATPFDLVSFHLPTGDRTMLPVHIMLLAASLSVLYSPGAKAETSLT